MKGYNSNTPETEKDRAQTPLWLFQAVENFMGYKFELDAAAEKQTTKASNYYGLDKGDDSLSKNWSPKTWVNPPFSNVLPFIEKAGIEATAGNETVMIIPNNPETKYVRTAKQTASAIIEMPFRIKFNRPDGKPFLDKKGREQGPQFSCLIAIFNKPGLLLPTSMGYIDFREFINVG